MKLSDFDYNLPKELIAQEPIKPRDQSRLLVMDKKSGQLTDQNFYDISEYFNKGDVLVLNNSKVFPARLIGNKKNTGGKIEVFLLKKINGKIWQCLIGGHGRKENLEIKFTQGLEAVVINNNQDGTWQVKFSKDGNEMMKVVNKIGITPLPPYIKSSSAKASEDKANYQTIYADERKIGSVAAPTAGLHFTPQLLKKIKAKGVEIVCVTLHVGLGTFAPVKTEDITKHKMHAEFIEVKSSAIKKILLAKQESRRVIAVGTTSVRTLESLAEFLIPMTRDKHEFLNRYKNLNLKNYLKIKNYKIKNFSAFINIFIYPGYKFKIVDAMITNFHLPKSTLLMLVSAFAGKKNIDKAYKHAIRKKYRFYSYGDAMFIA